MGENGTCHICAFHIAQTLYKTVNTEGMKPHFRQCKMFREFILAIQCTNFLPADEIVPTLNVGTHDTNYKIISKKSCFLSV